MKLLLLALAIVAAHTVTSPAAAAGDAAAQEAVTLLREGLALVDQAAVDGDLNKYDLACLKFRESYSLSPRAKPLFNLGLAEKKLGRFPDAVHHFRQFIRSPDADATAIARAEKLVTELGSKVASVWLEAPLGALLFVDGEPVEGKPPLVDPIDVPPGKHSIEMRLGDKTTTQSIDAPAGATSRVDFQITATPPPPPEASAPPVVAPKPTPALPTMIPPVAGDTGGRGSSTARSVAAVAFGTAAVVGLGIGVGFTVAASHASDDQGSFARQNPPYACSGAAFAPACGRWNDASKSHVTDTNVATGAFVVTALSAVGCAATLLLWPPSRGRSAYAWQIAPNVTSAGGGASVTGKF